MRLYTRLIIFTFLQYCILCEAQENENTDITNFIPTPTTTFSTSVNNTGDASSTISSTTTVEVLPTNSGSDGSGSTATSTNETSANFSTPVSFTASPTSSVLTYFPFPTRTGSSTSIISSGRPSPSAPFPDDTVVELFNENACNKLLANNYNGLSQYYALRLTEYYYRISDYPS
ncbi:hypothetical protein BDF20DRAFT_910331 [Mycotypha africana]|uniref:uncharacterized protein n=1 Tax=Mycotypha africana TaxID=64632 RepID=UPI0023010525|nr:uncharacterized protein BDF20DRAFT_910331 [Mycotypha africana]KAI8987772.1 hypothetical protein BDF20DRAFT_910331 [Mycotypha africana]